MENLQNLMLSRRPTSTHGGDEMGWIEIDDHHRCLAIGSLIAAQNIGELEDKGITHVLTVASRLKVWRQDQCDVEKNYPSFLKGYLQVDLIDHPGDDLFAVMPSCLEFLQQALEGNKKSSNRVLVHCASGVSRSVSIVVGFLMKMGYATSFDESLTKIRKGRPGANPNVGFFHQLLSLEQTAPDYDLNLARTYYQELLKGKSIMELIQRQRDDANALHTQLDMITRSSGTDNQVLLLKLQEWLALNLKEVNQIQSYPRRGVCEKGKESVVKIIDRPSNSIRRAAIEHAKSLVEKLQHESSIAK